MSNISFEKFLSWAEQRFGDVVVRGNEIKLNSIFCEDFKHHLSCNPYGGKRENRPHGVYRCLKTDKKGTLIGLVMLVDRCDFAEAEATLSSGLSIYELEDEVNRLFSNEPAQQVIVPPIDGIPLPEATFRISDLAKDDIYRENGEFYLSKRGLPTGRMLICKEGVYRDRIIIPYYDKEGRLIYWNGRYIGSDKKAIRYMGPPLDEVKIGKSDVIYMAGGLWPSKGSKIFITEGELCAESFRVAGFYSGAFGGKSLSEKQAEMLRDYQLCIGLDNDSSGEKALGVVGEYFVGHGFKDLSYIRPPINYKDWNQLMVATSSSILRAYVEKFEKKYDSWTSIMREANSL